MTLFNRGNVFSSDSLAPNRVGRGPGGAVGVENLEVTQAAHRDKGHTVQPYAAGNIGYAAKKT